MVEKERNSDPFCLDTLFAKADQSTTLSSEHKFFIFCLIGHIKELKEEMKVLSMHLGCGDKDDE